MKNKECFVFYVSYFPEEDFDLALKTSKSLSSHHKVVYFYIYDDFVNFKQLLTEPKWLWVFLKKIYDLAAKNLTGWRFFGFLPFGRFEIVRKLNVRLNIFILSVVAGCRRRVLITNNGKPETELLVKAVNPDLAIGERVDIWSDENYDRLLKHLDCFVSNSKKLNYRENSKSQMINTYVSDKGYVSRKILEILHKKHVWENAEKSIIYIGNIEWKMDFSLLRFLLKNLREYRFIFVGSLLLGNKRPLNELAKKVQKQWGEIKKLANVSFYEVKDEESLADLDVKASLGIIPYDVSFPLCKYGGFPIKLNYYFAMGTPVVSRKILSIERFQGSYLRIAEEKEDFLMEVKKRLEKKFTLKERTKMYKIALGNTYEKKAEFFNRVIAEELERKERKVKNGV